MFTKSVPNVRSLSLVSILLVAALSGCESDVTVGTPFPHESRPVVDGRGIPEPAPLPMPTSMPVPAPAPMPAPLPAPVKPADADGACSASVAPAGDRELSLADIVDGDPGFFRLENLRVSRLRVLGGNRQEFSVQLSGTTQTRSSGYAGQVRTSCVQSANVGSEMSYPLAARVAVPTYINRANGEKLFDLRINASYEPANAFRTRAADATVVSATQPNLSDELYGPNSLWTEVSFYRLDNYRFQIYLVSRDTDHGAHAETRVSAIYRSQVYLERDRAPTASPTPAPVIVPVPAPAPAPAPANPPTNRRCGINGSDITIDGQSAFYYYSADDRIRHLKELVASGFCGSDSKLGVNGSDITLNGHGAFYFYSPEDRQKALVRLYSRGAGSTAYSRCGVDGSNITLDGNTAFYYYSPNDRLEKLLELMASGICSQG